MGVHVIQVLKRALEGKVHEGVHTWEVMGVSLNPGKQGVQASMMAPPPKRRWGPATSLPLPGIMWPGRLLVVPGVRTLWRVANGKVFCSGNDSRAEEGDGEDRRAPWASAPEFSHLPGFLIVELHRSCFCRVGMDGK